MSAPEVSIDSFGFVTWTIGDVTPAYWGLEMCLVDGKRLKFYNQNLVLDGAETSFDAAAEWWGIGMYITLYGLGSDNQLILLPSISATPLSY